VRKTIGFKFSLGYGTLSADQGTVISRRLTKTRRGATPFYGVKIKNKVRKKFLFTKQSLDKISFSASRHQLLKNKQMLRIIAIKPHSIH
jgi:hypothetical protein